MNLRQWTYFRLLDLRDQPLGVTYERFLRENQRGIPPDTTKKLLTEMLSHCEQRVPYYTGVMRDLGDSFREDPEEYLKSFPVLTKDIIRNHFDELKSSDLSRRKWYLDATGGSTGEPIQFIHDWDYAVRSGAITLLFSKLAGREIGECEALLWGSVEDILQKGEHWKARIINKITNTFFLNAFQMTPERMREFISTLNSKRPKLIVAYTEAIYELARFIGREGLHVAPQSAIMTSAGTLYPFMRMKIEEVFQCRVFNRYGSREAGDIACERPDSEGLWVAPWGNYLEIVDSKGMRVPDGTEGEILVTSLNNYAMPLIRYKIGDRGVLSPKKSLSQGNHEQVLEAIVGRSGDTLKSRQGVFVDSRYFLALLSYEDWIKKFQVIQRDPLDIVLKIAKSISDPPQARLDEIVARTKEALGEDCEVSFEFTDEIPASRSGKYRYIISEINDQ